MLMFQKENERPILTISIRRTVQLIISLSIIIQLLSLQNMFLRALILTFLFIFSYTFFYSSPKLCLRVKMMKRNKREWKGVVGVELKRGGVVGSENWWMGKERKERKGSGVSYHSSKLLFSIFHPPKKLKHSAH